MKKTDNGQLVYTVPYNVSLNFKEFFKEIDSDLERFGILEYTVRCTTLEEVFAKVGRKEEALEEEEFITVNRKT